MPKVRMEAQPVDWQWMLNEARRRGDWPQYEYMLRRLADGTLRGLPPRVQVYDAMGTTALAARIAVARFYSADGISNG